MIYRPAETQTHVNYLVTCATEKSAGESSRCIPNGAQLA